MTDSTEDPSQIQNNMESVLSQLLEVEASLRKKENSLRSKIEAEHNELEKIARRRDFYKKLQSNIGPKHAEAMSKLEVAEKAMEEVLKEIESIESQTKKLEIDLADVIAQNEADVLPELERLNKLLATSKEEVESGNRTCSNDEQRILELTSLSQTYNDECDAIRRAVDERTGEIEALPRPETFAKDLSKIEDDMNSIRQETAEVESKKKQVITESHLQRQRKDELDKLKTSDEEKLKKECAKIERQRHECDGYTKELAEERVRQHSLASIRVEIELNTAAEEDGLKHNTNFLNSVDNRQVNAGKQSLAKKRQFNANIKEVIPRMKAKADEIQHQLTLLQSEKSSLEKEQNALRTKVDLAVNQFLDQENIDEGLQRQVDETMKLVADQECEVERWRAEEKKASVILGFTREKRSVVRRKIEHAMQTKADIENSIRLQQLIDIDLSKKNNDATSKTKELSTLCGMIEDEKLETTRLIKASNETLTLLNKKCGELQAELRALTLERDQKNDTLQLLRKDIEVSCETRAYNRRDKSISWNSCRAKIDEISNAEARVEKFKATLNLTRKEVERMELQNQQMLKTRQSMSEQLAARKSQLLSLFKSSNSYTETLKKGESICHQMEEEKKMIELKNNDLKRSIDILKSDLDNQAETKDKIERAKRSLELQILETERISAALESPNQDRIRTLEGQDPSEEELQQNISVLESLERNNREVLRNKATAIKEITKQSEELKAKSNSWKASTQHYLKDINDYQGRLHELQRVLTSQMSELRMYASLVEKLNVSKQEVERDITLRANLEYKPPEPEVLSTTPVKKKQQQAKEPRPTAYLPDGDEEEIIRIPRPFGGMAPFKPMQPGSTMRHIRKPQPVPLIHS